MFDSLKTSEASLHESNMLGRGKSPHKNMEVWFVGKIIEVKCGNVQQAIYDDRRVDTISHHISQDFQNGWKEHLQEQHRTTAKKGKTYKSRVSNQRCVFSSKTNPLKKCYIIQFSSNSNHSLIFASIIRTFMNPIHGACTNHPSFQAPSKKTSMHWSNPPSTHSLKPIESHLPQTIHQPSTINISLISTIAIHPSNFYYKFICLLWKNHLNSPCFTFKIQEMFRHPEQPHVLGGPKPSPRLDE